MSGPTLLTGSSTEKLDPIVDATGTTKLKGALQSRTTSVGPVSPQLVGTHNDGDTFAATDPEVLEGTIGPDGLIHGAVGDNAGRRIVSHMAPGAVVFDTQDGAGGGGDLTATLAGDVGVVTHICGFQVTGMGATAALGITVQVSDGSWTLDYVVAVPADVDASIEPLVVEFPFPFPASSPNTPITVAVPDFGAGCTAFAVNAQGFQL